MAKLYKCRRCKTLLDRSQHIVFSHFEERRERLTSDRDDPFPTYHMVQHPVNKHVPCPNCGEAEPLNTIAANLPAVITFFSITIVVLAGAIWMLFFM